ncbi:hypothetical protein DB88DRAFT_497136 [Papiliotrema laurentii]|uniref:MARVEL domain-containing protein n=1 Tax=Papiliotrema laurentii TaxID=5418 RepID=A0AAD9CTZ2_PAPLA|nr:hypothetical protein DB88DRAFT_497136 [Papiliotrema laurentii]
MGALLGRTLAGLFFFASAGVVLGISAYFTSNYARAYIHYGEVTLLLVVSGLTVLFELLWIPLRFCTSGGPTSLAVEVVVLSLLWVLWLAAAATYTAFVKDALTVCNNKDLYYQAIRQTGYGSTVSSVARSSLDKGCAMIQADVAFAWISWIVATFMLVWTVYYATSRSSWRDSFRDGPTARRASFDEMRETKRGSIATNGTSVAGPAETV